MVIALFRARVRPENSAEYLRLADEVAETARAMPGFRSWKVYVSDDGERVSVHEWDDEESLAAWSQHPLHLKMKALGRERFYEEYSAFVCPEPRSSHFPS